MFSSLNATTKLRMLKNYQNDKNKDVKLQREALRRVNRKYASRSIAHSNSMNRLPMNEWTNIGLPSGMTINQKSRNALKSELTLPNLNNRNCNSTISKEASNSITCKEPNRKLSRNSVITISRLDTPKSRRKNSPVSLQLLKKLFISHTAQASLHSNNQTKSK